MKKKIIISMMTILMLILGQGAVKAASPTVTVAGEDKVKTGETGTVTINVTSGEEKAGVVSGKIETDAKMESITVEGINRWNLTYNEATGEFNIVKAAGADTDTESCLRISYTIKSDATGTASIKMSNLKVTSIDYQTESVSNVTKEITIETEPTPDPTPEPTPEPQVPTGGEQEDGTASGTTTNKNDASVAKTSIPQTGVNSIVIVVVGILLVNGVVMFIRYKKMNY